MRSSIACTRCRRSKVKCVNNGVGTTCRACENSGRECSYPSPVTSGTRRRDSPPARTDAYGDVERRQRPRKSANTTVANPVISSRESPRPRLDALDSRLLTPTVWQELFDIFQIHYSADLPFLHPPTFLKPLRNAHAQHSHPSLSTSGDHTATARPPASIEFLMAFLALTARFHPKLVAHHLPPTSTRPSNPLIASEYYAAAANELVASLWTDNKGHDIERTQAILMLGLHEWGMCRGAKAWLAIGTAIRAAQAMGLQYELDLDDEPMSRSLALNGEAERLGVDPNRKSSTAELTGEDMFIQQEIRRRTFWSCYIMDRYLSSGKYRPQMLHARELRIQLPASERSFLFAEKVRTLMLGEDDKNVAGTGRAEVQNHRHQSVMLGTGTPEPNTVPSPESLAKQETEEEKGRLETGADEGLVSRYVKILEIYGKVIKWSCSGGRRVEEHPPWDPRSEFHKLRRQCAEFKASLPRQHALTPQNTQAHISLKTSTPYLLVHTVYLLCQVMLNREYVPFIPIRCSKPEGPLDAPVFPPDKYQVPPGFWEESARDCFRSAREIMDLVRTCQEWNALVETPIVGFVIYIVAFVGVYCINFPWMDPTGYMCTGPEPSAMASTTKQGESEGFEAARKALEMIGQMRCKLQMADGWFKTINRMHRYFRRMKSDYRKNAQAMESSSEGDSPISTRHLSLREGGAGGGLNEFKLLERTLHEFGNIEDEDVEMLDDQGNNTRPLDAVYDDSSAGTTVKSEEPGDRLAPTGESVRPDSGAWSAINANPSATAGAQATSAPANGHFRSYESYPQQQQRQPQQTHPYAHQINGFRPSLTEPPPGASSSLASPTSYTAAGTTPQSQPTPPFDRSHTATYSNWQPQNSSYSMQPPPPNPYTNGATQHNATHTASHQLSSSGHSAYSNAGHSLHPSHQMQHLPPPQQHGWEPMTKEAWLNSIDTRLGGDDVAAFVDGGEMADWANLAAQQGFGGGWLSTVWGGGGA